MKQVFYVVLSWWSWTPLHYLDPPFTKLYVPLLRLPLQVWGHTSTTNSKNPDPELLRIGFHEHYAHIRKVVPGERLLEWHPRDGWEPLCRHLGVEVPADVKGEAFPRINDPQTTQAILAGVVWSKWISVGVRVAKVAALGGVAVLGWRYWKGGFVLPKLS